MNKTESMELLRRSYKALDDLLDFLSENCTNLEFPEAEAIYTELEDLFDDKKS